MPNCYYCNQFIVMGGKVKDNKRFCSDDCVNDYLLEREKLNELAREGKKYAEGYFCDECLYSTLEEPFRGARSFEDVGTELFGNADKCPRCGSTIKTLRSVFSIFKFPIRSYRVKKVGKNEWVGRALPEIYGSHKKWFTKREKIMLSILAGIIIVPMLLITLLDIISPEQKVTSSNYVEKPMAKKKIKGTLYSRLESELQNKNYKKVLDMLPKNRTDAKYELMRANALCGLKRYKEAWKYYKKAAHLNKSDPAPFFYAGKMLEKMGKRERAIKLYKKALKIDSSCTAASMALTHLLIPK